MADLMQSVRSVLGPDQIQAISRQIGASPARHEARRMQNQGTAGGLLGAVLDRDGDGDVDLSHLMQNGQLLGGLLGRR